MWEEKSAFERCILAACAFPGRLVWLMFFLFLLSSIGSFMGEPMGNDDLELAEERLEMLRRQVLCTHTGPLSLLTCRIHAVKCRLLALP